VKIVVAGKGGSGKTTLTGTIARSLARAGHSVLGLDADANPMLGISLGIEPLETDRLVAVRQALDAGDVDHEPTIDGIVDTFGTDAPDGVRLVVVSRIDRPDPGCPCCGVSPEQLLSELDGEGRIVVCDLEAGLGTLLRMGPDHADLALIVANPTVKSMEVARRAVEIAEPKTRVIVVANRVRDEADVEGIRGATRAHELVVVPEEPAVSRADREGIAPIDAGPDSPGVLAIVELAERLAVLPTALRTGPG
jgi:CO dehydrogenase maturation factor